MEAREAIITMPSVLKCFFGNLNFIEVHFTKEKLPFPKKNEVQGLVLESSLCDSKLDLNQQCI